MITGLLIHLNGSPAPTAIAHAAHRFTDRTGQRPTIVAFHPGEAVEVDGLATKEDQYVRPGFVLVGVER